MESNSANNTVVKLSNENEIAVLELDDGKANALNHDVIASLIEKLDEVEDSGAVVITGRPERFSAGFDPNTEYSPAKYEDGKLKPAENK